MKNACQLCDIDASHHLHPPAWQIDDLLSHLPNEAALKKKIKPNKKPLQGNLTSL